MGAGSARRSVTVLLGDLRPRSRFARVPLGRAAPRRPPQAAARSSAPPEAAAAGERGQHALAEALVHEAVYDGVDAG